MRTRFLITLLLSVLLTGCINMRVPAVLNDGFSASGRMSIRHGAESHYANFGWQSSPNSDQIALGNPLGQTVAELQIYYQKNQAVYATLTDAQGQIQAGEAEQLLFDNTGLRLPVFGLRWWLQGQAAPGEAKISHDEVGTHIDQSGWQILASDYMQHSPTLRGPRKIVMTRADLAVRIIISEWQWQSTPQP